MKSAGVDLNGESFDLDRLHIVLLRLNRRIRVSSHDEISPSQRLILATVYHYGPVSISQIAEREHVQSPSASKNVAALERLGLVRRSRDPNDRRSSLISMTPRGCDLVDDIRAAALSFLADRLHELEPGDIEALDRSLAALERLVGSVDDIVPQPGTSAEATDEQPTGPDC